LKTGRHVGWAISSDGVAVLLLVGLVVLVWLPRAHGPIDLRWDAAVYYELGTALAEGKGYRLLNEPGEIEAVLSPPLLPVVVAVPQLILGTHDPVAVGSWLRGLWLLMFTAMVVATYVLLRDIARAPYAFLGTIICTLSLSPIWLSDRLYADVPFALVAVLFAVRAGIAARSNRDVWGWALATAAFLLRTIGVVVLIAWVAERIIHRQPRAAVARLLIAAIPVVAWQVYVHHIETEAIYSQPQYAYQRADYNLYNVTYSRLFSLTDHLNPSLGKAGLTERAERVPRNVPAIIGAIGGAISAPRREWELAFEKLKQVRVVKHLIPWRSIDVVLGLLGCLILGGLAVQSARRELILSALVLMYLAALATMPSSYFIELARYVWVLSPLLMRSAFVASATLYRRLGDTPGWLRRTTVVAAAGIVAVVVALNLVSVTTLYASSLHVVRHADWNGRPVEYRLFTYNPDYAEVDAALEWLKAHAASTDVVASTTPHWVYLRTGIKAVLPPFEIAPAASQRQLDTVPVRFVIVADWLSRKYALPAVEARPSRWRRVFVEGECSVYERTVDAFDESSIARR
jgi:hypothetical protein